MTTLFSIPHLINLNCEITVQKGSLSSLAIDFQPYSSVILITDTHVAKLFEKEIVSITQPIKSKTIVLPAGETEKKLENAADCWKKMADFGADRHSLVIALGGGMITDLAGFVAACYMRGIDHIAIPTTLLGMVDAAIGGKTAVNLPPYKNLVGCIHQAKKVYIFPELLKTLPKRELVAGFAEIIKAAIIADPILFEELENRIEQILQGDMESLERVIHRACEIKAEIVAADEKEKGLRAHLNFGHSIGHAIESATGYNRFLHGEAVSIGMVLEAKLSYLMGECEKSVWERIKKLCCLIGLPIELSDVVVSQVLELMERDKKNSFGKFSLIVVQKIGKVVCFKDVDRAVIAKTLGIE